MDDFETFFKTATGHDHPRDYQRRLACGECDLLPLAHGGAAS